MAHMILKTLLGFTIISLFACTLVLPRSEIFTKANLFDVSADFPSIQAAINNASNGDVIFVQEGTYFENVVVNKTVSLVGENKETTVIDGNGTGVTVRITAENVTIKSLTIRGGGSDVYESGVFIGTVSSNITDNIILENGLFGICLNYSSNCFIARNVIKQNGFDGIVLYNSFSNAFLTNTVTDNKFGFHLYSSHQNRISNNTLTENSLGGISLVSSTNNSLINNELMENTGYAIILDYSSDNNTVEENRITLTEGFGLTIGSCSNNTFRNNAMTKNTYNFHCPATRPNLSDFLNDVDTSNTVNGKPIYYVTSQKGLLMDPSTFPNAGYIALINCTDMTVKGLSFSENGQGILLAFTNNTIIEDIEATGNDYGIQLLSSFNNTITNSTPVNNSEDGITLDYSSTKNIVANSTLTNNSNAIRMAHHTNENLICNNIIVNNTKGIWSYSYNMLNTIQYNILENNNLGISMERVCNNNTIIQNTIKNNAEGAFFNFCSNNSIYSNNFLNNTVQVADRQGSVNFWDGGRTVAGNYWSNYTGADHDYDGIGDTLHVVDTNNTDRYPLMGTFYDFELTLEHGETCHVQVVSNSTVKDLAALCWLSSVHENPEAEQRYIQFSVTGENDTEGFCRVVIPRNVLNGTYIVLVDWQETPVNELASSNATHALLYFSYEHTTRLIIIIPESTLITLFLLFILSSALTITARRRTGLFTPSRNRNSQN